MQSLHDDPHNDDNEQRDASRRGRRVYDVIPAPSAPRWPQYVQLIITIVTIVYGVSVYAESMRESAVTLQHVATEVENLKVMTYDNRSDIDVLKCRDGITCTIR